MRDKHRQGSHVTRVPLLVLVVRQNCNAPHAQFWLSLSPSSKHRPKTGIG